MNAVRLGFERTSYIMETSQREGETEKQSRLTIPELAANTTPLLSVRVHKDLQLRPGLQFFLLEMGSRSQMVYKAKIVLHVYTIFNEEQHYNSNLVWF
jgi:uncharacterized protein YqjF (DUF2071 family)